mmetsp:Transcript_43579/g.100417  ORF Transcript_43579/g.100417 Transcript_43579/m.100417 type:complete len:101 (-) Transcript_43579:22-324(-)
MEWAKRSCPFSKLSIFSVTSAHVSCSLDEKDPDPSLVANLTPALEPGGLLTVLASKLPTSCCFRTACTVRALRASAGIADARSATQCQLATFLYHLYAST